MFFELQLDRKSVMFILLSCRKSEFLLQIPSSKNLLMSFNNYWKKLQNRPNQSQTYYKLSIMKNNIAKVQEIQNKLNFVCSEHDQLMSLLAIYDCAPNLQQWQRNAKAIEMKISTFEFALNNYEGIPQIQLSKVSENQSIAFQILKERIEDCREKLCEQRQFIKMDEQTQIDKIIQDKISLNSKSIYEDALISMRKMIAQYKNDIQMLQKRQKSRMKANRLNNSINEQIEREESIIEFCYQQQRNQLKSLRTQIQMIKSQLPQHRFDHFHQFTVKRLKQELITINNRIENICEEFIRNQSIQSSQSPQMRFIHEIQSKLYFIRDRIQGLRQRGLKQVMKLYSSNESGQNQKFETNKLQKLIVSDIRYLILMYEKIKDKLECILKNQ